MKTQVLHNPKFVAPGDGHSIPVLGVDHVVKISGADTDGTITFGEVIVPPGGGPPPHVHSREDELFYVLEGTLDVLLGERTYQAPAGSLAYLPRGIAHTFHNSTDRTARFTALITPPDFIGFFEDLKMLVERPSFQFPDVLPLGDSYGLEFRPERVQTHAGPNAMGERGLIAAPGQGRHTPYQGGRVTIPLAAADTHGVVAVGVVSEPPGGGPPAHVHRTFDELFYVLDGEFLFRAGGQDYIARPGATVSVPRGTAHQFRNIGGTLGRLLTYWTPAGFEEFFLQVGALEAAGRLTLEAMLPIAHRLDTEALMNQPQLWDLTPDAVAALRREADGAFAVPA